MSAKVDDFELGTWISLIRIVGIYKTHTKCCPLAVPLSTNLFDSCIHCEKKFACNKVSYWNWISELWKPSQTRKVSERGERVIGVLKVFTYTFKVAKHHNSPFIQANWKDLLAKLICLSSLLQWFRDFLDNAELSKKSCSLKSHFEK